MALGRKTGGRVAGVPNKRTLARQLAEAEATCALTEQFQGNSLALLQLIYRSSAFDIRTRIDAAKAALAYEQPRPAATDTAASDVVPLHERLREYAREKAIKPAHGV